VRSSAALRTFLKNGYVLQPIPQRAPVVSSVSLTAKVCVS